MASTLNAVIGAAVAILFWTSLGLILTRRLVPAGLALPMAPVVGWATHSALALPIFMLVPVSAANVILVAAIAVVAAAAASRFAARCDDAGGGRGVPAWVYAAAALLAMVPAAAVIPKTVGDAVYLAAPIFDHAKVAMIDDMMKFGVPAGNPFFAATPQLVYYYLWHFSAAELGAATGITGWEADAALTGFTAASSLALMMGLATWWGGRAAAFLTVILAALASGRPVLWWLVGAANVDAIIGRAAGFAGWLFQTGFAPQHTMAAACVCAAAVLISRLAIDPRALTAVALGLLVAAGFESSAWIGGIVFAVAAPVVVLIVMPHADARLRLRFLGALAVAAVLALGLSAPFLRDQASAIGARASPIALQFYPVLGGDLSQRLHTLLDPAAFWLALLPLELPAIYLTGAVGLGLFAFARKGAADEKRLAGALAALAAVSLIVSWLLASTVGDNDDLGWRAVLLAATVLTPFAAAALSRWIAGGARIAAMAGIGAMLVAVPDSVSLIGGDIAGEPRSEGRLFAETPALWAAVRRHAAPDERVGNNPLFLAAMTLWPVNISWALLSDRRSCYAGREIALISPTLPLSRLDELDALFIRAFDGNVTPDDVAALATTHDCRIIVVAPSDGAWVKDPFAASPRYRLVEERADRWRIYRATEASP